MLNIAICDDDSVILKDISNKIKEMFSVKEVDIEIYITNSSKDLINYINKINVDILFTDIDMPDHNGMEVAEYICNKGLKTLLIFITNYESLVYQSFKYHPFSFIRKNYFSQEIEQVVDSAINLLQNREEHLSIKTNNEFIRVRLSEIMYFEAELNYVKVVMEDKSYYFRESLRELDKALFSKGFIRIHKGYIVNQKYIHAFRNNEIELSNGLILPIGRASKDTIRKQIMKYMR